nr:cobaltochelatase subunit CobN [uncultured Desulfobacter sp.]
MNFFALFQTILYTISTALLVPVVVLLIILCLWLFLYTGGFFGEWIKRRQKRSKTPLSTFLEEISRGRTLPQEVQSMLPAHISAYAGDLENILKSPGILKAEKIEDLNQKKQHALLKSVDKIRIVVRTGPSLGLMGTLIPMGTGLSGLTQGNMAQLSSSLILAFTTTVVDIVPIPGLLLQRPRIDVLIQASGLFRDSYAKLIKLMDRAVGMASKLKDVENCGRS